MILIVDDKQENLFSLKTLLQLHSYEVDTASSGEDALRKILKNDYALIILDVQMPGMDGFEVAEAINGYSKARNIPIIFLSAVNIDKRFITKGYASGGVDYVTKPFDPDLLLLKVKTFTKLHDQTKELQQMQEVLKAEVESRKLAHKALEEVNLLLEDKVKDRTKELLQANKELELNNIELQQYASVASHDLQEPLRKIMTFSHMLNDKYIRNNPEAEQLLKRILASTERMRSLINDLLNYSKLSVASPFINADLNNIVEETIADLELSINEKSAQVIVDQLPQAEVIPGQMRQVFQNIISNALKFSRKDTAPVINIWAEYIDKKNAESPPIRMGEYMRIFVRDNGIGFNEMFLEKIFTLFQRLHGRTEYEGTGIGLAIVKKIIDKHNGLITAKSQEGEGTTFIIVLPVKQTPVLTHSTLKHN
jgi:signal transduction histidine kinase